MENVTESHLFIAGTNATAEVTSDQHDTNQEPCFTRAIVCCQNAVSSFRQRHKKRISFAVKAFFIGCYFVYFGYAMYFSRLKDEASIRLLWVTCVVVLFLAVRKTSPYLNRFFKDMHEWRVLTSCRGRQRLVNRIVLLTIFILMLLFVVIDVALVTCNPYNIVSLAGLLVYLLLLFVFSSDPSKVNFQTVMWGVSLQFIVALVVLRWSVGYAVLSWLGDRVTEFLSYSDAGARFVFGDSFSEHLIAFQVLPVIIYFSAVVSIMFYLGAIQYVIKKIAWLMQVTMETTAAESLNAAGNIFLGQTESPLMIRPLLPDMTKSELHAVMTGGFATIAGSVIAAYILFGVPANHLLSASIMSAPAALACAKLFYPETEESKTSSKHVQSLPKGSDVNILDAASNGASNAVSLAATIGANMIAFIALQEFVNATLTWFGQRIGVAELTFQTICSYALWPLALVMGVDVTDCRKVARLIGTKVFVIEFAAFVELGQYITNRQLLDAHISQNGTWHWQGDDVMLTSSTDNHTVLINGIISERSVLISTYALCGFSNFVSIGIQIGSLSAMAPARRGDLASVALRAMIAGNVACFMTACVAGLFYQPIV